ncbi:MAG: phosphotransferase [Rhodospirillales bacterium]|nr:phosphotransferase [Rhodospirillales bacterium]
MPEGTAERASQVARFLATEGWDASALRPLAGDASFRTYSRLHDGRRRAVLMDAPPEREDVRPFVRMAEHLRGLGLSAPKIYAADPGAGLLLLEDLGDETFTRLLTTDADEVALYALAVDVLSYLHRLPADRAVPSGLPLYDICRLVDEALLLVDWHLPAVLAQPLPPEARAAYVAVWEMILPTVMAQPPSLVLRDFHIDNLLRLQERAGIAACGLLDFQDAATGAAAYDLMSLLEDARRDIAEPLRAAMLIRYRESALPYDVKGFETTYAILSAQRHAKVIGIFTRLSRRDQKHSYLSHIPRVWRLLERALEHPSLAPVAGWFKRHVPEDRRVIPQLPTATQ